ncbi:DNA-binding response regulator [Hahella sp. CCB-MM4]|uniref:response regulator n=1 Tax=Hahella sp. (strain CCB-MM4) TaxID=1926491 RepID=UPI000BCF0ED9|nr:response regulator transcription factor [Hahella sp. CCB-MM4]OZG72577.1 DNA-binding response regulator [Hahella sp. CCB-MM4]
MHEIPKYRILIVDDEQDIREVLEDCLQQAGYLTTAVATGTEMFQALEQDISLLIMDLRLKGEDGLILARQVREQSTIPIMMLTGKGDETDRILGLELAADDYLMKPFNVRELVARVNALIRRSTRLSANGGDSPGSEVTQEHDCLMFGNWILDLTARELRHQGGQIIDLTFGEFALLEVLAKHPKRVFSREELLERTRGDQTDVFDRTIDVQILRIRRKIEPNPKTPMYIRTERGIGYIFSQPVQKNRC